jgi:hypothetical protein
MIWMSRIKLLIAVLLKDGSLVTNSLRLLSFACNGKLRSFVFFVDFSSSFLRYLLVICMLLLQTWCRIFLSIFFGVECNKIFPYFGFF